MVIVLIMVPKAPSTFPSSSDLPASPWLCPPVCYSHCRIGKGIYCCLHWFSVTSVRNYRKFIWWLNVTEIHSLTVLEARTPKSVSLGQKSKCQMGCFPSDFLGENLSFVSSSFWRLWMFLSWWPHHSRPCLSGHTAFSPLPVSNLLLLPSYTDTCDCT